MSGPIGLAASNNRAWQSQPVPQLARGSMPVESTTEDYPHAGKRMQANGLTETIPVMGWPGKQMHRSQ